MFPRSASGPPDQYRMADLEFFPAGDNLVLACTRSGHKTCFLRAEIVDLLTNCREFKPLDEHIQAYCQGGQANAVMISTLRRELQRLAQNGYLLSQSDILADLHRSVERDLSPGITCIGFPTSERVETLQRGLSSYLEHCQHFGRTCDFVVMDNSTRPTVREAYRQMLRDLRSRYGVSIAYAGLEEKMAFIEKLSEMGDLPFESVSFACIGDEQYGTTRVGANRNAMLLHTVGECIFSVDDDTLCQITAAPNRQEHRLSFRSRGDPVEVWFFADQQSMLRSVQFVEQDLLTLHEQWLGKDPCSSVTASEQEYEIEFDQAEPRFLQRLQTGLGTCIVTMNGVVGDCRWDNPHYSLFLQGDSFDRLTLSEQEYHSARATREMLQAVKQTTVTERAGPLFATCIG
ncbi:MAG TPA: hypothetical protein VH593_16590, partial [Ktedonobacteraceae bacterium]